MPEVNETGPAPADQRATAEAIERGGIGLSVTDLLARVAPGAEGAQPVARDEAELSQPVARDEAEPAHPVAPDAAQPSHPLASAHPEPATVPHPEPAPAPGDEPAPAPRDEPALVSAVAALAGRYVPAGHLPPDADFFDAGGTSVHAVELVAALEADLGLTIDLDEVFADARPASLVRRATRAAGVATAVRQPAAQTTTETGTPAPALPV
ncbi:acyl carrier protein, partial [Streptomyces sp. NRRL WC-3604]|uniref:acyl carrier protein n=1 Tax=Streptomyces sp. NRRL WC-3604 TaxID=1609102 RepID=UPI000A6D54BD